MHQQGWFRALRQRRFPLSATRDTDSISVLLVNQYYAPAAVPTARLLANVGSALVVKGHDVSVICSRRGYQDASMRFPRHEIVDGVTVHRLPGTRFTQKRRWGRIGNYLSFFAMCVPRLLTTRRPDVVVCLSTPPLLASIVLCIASLRGARTVYWVMDVHPELAFRVGQLTPTSITGQILEATACWALGKADAVVAIGDDMAKQIRPYTDGNIRVVHNWADGDRIKPAESADHPLRKEWGWDGKFIVAYSGNMGLVHEFDTVIEAATRLRDDSRYLFCFIGAGPRADEVRAEVELRKLHNVEFRDYVAKDRIPLSLTAPNVHLVTLREDLAGLSVPSKTYGILAAGKPVAFVGPVDSEVASIIRQNGCGMHVPNGDVDRLVSCFRSYRDSLALLTEHSKAARQAFESHFTQDRGLASLVSVIQDTEFPSSGSSLRSV